MFMALSGDAFNGLRAKATETDCGLFRSHVAHVSMNHTVFNHVLGFRSILQSFLRSTKCLGVLSALSCLDVVDFMDLEFLKLSLDL